MPVSDILRNRTGRLTNQQIANFMLEEDRAARAAAKRGDYIAEQRHKSEVERQAKALA